MERYLVATAIFLTGCASAGTSVSDGGKGHDAGAAHDFATDKPIDLATEDRATPIDSARAVVDFASPPGCTSCTGLCCGNTCVDQDSDNFNCGTCGHACSGGQSCQAGSCITPAVDMASTCNCTSSCFIGSCTGGCCPEDIIAGSCTPDPNCLFGLD